MPDYRKEIAQLRNERRKNRGAESAPSSLRSEIESIREQQYGASRPKTPGDRIREQEGLEEAYRRMAGKSKEYKENIANPQPNFRFNSLEEYDEALKAAEEDINKGSYTWKNVVNAMINSPLSQAPALAKASASYGNRYTDAERYYSDLKKEASKYKNEHAYEELRNNYINNADFAAKSGDLTADEMQSLGSREGVQFYEANTRLMDDEEKQIANYIFRTEGIKGLQEYFNKVMPAINERAHNAQMAKQNKWLDEKTADIEKNDIYGAALSAVVNKDQFYRNALASLGTIPANLLGGLGSIGEFVDSVGHGREYNPYSGAAGLASWAEDTREGVAENITEATGSEKVLPFAYQTLMSVGDSALGAVTLGNAYTPLMGGTAFNSTYRNVKEKGGTEQDAIVTALSAGIFEALFEEVSIDNLLKPKNIGNLKVWAKETIKQAGIEGSEEVFTELANIFSDQVINGINSDVQIRIQELRDQGYSEADISSMVAEELALQVGEAGLGGVLSGLLMGGVGNTIQARNFHDVGKDLDRKAFEESLSEDVKNNLKAEYGENWSEKVSNTQMGAIYADVMEQTFEGGSKEAQKAATDAIAKTYNVSKEEAAKYSKALFDSEATDKEKKILESHFGSVIIDDIRKGNGFFEAVSQAERKTYNTARNIHSSFTTATAKAQQAGFSIADKTSVNGKDAKITGLKKDGKNLIVVTDQGEVKANDKGVKFSNQDAQLIAMASEFRDERMANAFVANYKGQDLDTYANDMKLAYAYGSKEGLGINELKKDIPNFNIDSESIINMYEAGVAARNAIDNEAKKANEEIRKNYSGTFRKGTFTSDVKVENLNSTERQLYLMAQSFSDMGINVKVIHDTDKNSKNGEYDKKTNTVTINLAARYAKKGDPFDRRYAVNTMAHELTHWMEENAKTEFAALKGMIWEYFDRTGIDKEKLIHDEMRGGISDKAAESEVMARACEDMLSNPDTYAQITANANKSFHEKFREAVLKVIDKIKDLLNRMMKGYGSNATAATFVRQNQEAFEKFREQWIKTFNEALKFNQALNEYIEKNVQDVEDIKNSSEYSMKADVEINEDDLMAFHNLDEASLLKTIKLGGFAMPSIAVKRAITGHVDYGPITVVFPKQTIENDDMFSGDAWTPTFPEVDNKISEKVREKIYKKVMDLVGGYEMYHRTLNGANLDTDNLTDIIGRKGNAVEGYKNNRTLQYAFLQDTGKGFDVPMKEKQQFSNLSNEAIGAIAKVLGEETIEQMREGGYSWMREHPEEVNRLKLMLNEAAIKEYEANVANGTKPENEFLRKHYATMFGSENEQLAFADFDKATVAMWRLLKGTEQVVDTKEYERMLDERVDDEAYTKWLTDLFDGIIEKQGIRNNKDFFLPSGARRSWDALHYELTLENVVKVMKEQAAQGAAGFFSGSNIWGVATKKYKNLYELKADIGRLIHQNEAERDAQRSEFTERLVKIASEIMDKREDNPLIAHDRAANAIVDSLRGRKTVNAINKVLAEYVTLNVHEDTAQEILDLYNDILNMPTDYFEAKPRRAVGLDEIAYVVIPSTASDNLKNTLNEYAIPFYEYESENENDRIKVTNNAALEVDEDVLFSQKVNVREDSENEGKLPEYSHRGKYASALSRDEYDYLSRTIRKTIRDKAQNDESLNFSGVVYTEKHLVFYESYDDVNPEVIDVTTERKVINYVISKSKDTAFIDWYNTYVIGDGILGEGDREAVTSFAYGLGLQGYNRILQGSKADKGKNERLYSAKVDSEGNDLTEGQQVHFADSKIRDKDGNLLLVYHGTPNGGFTVFRNDLIYFTANKEYAKRYTRSSGSGKGGNTPHIYAGYLNIVNPFDITIPENKRIYIEEYIKGGYALGMNPYASNAEIENYAKAGIDWNEADNLKEFFDDMGYDFDGLILNEGGDLTEKGTTYRGNSYVAFNSNQFKLVDNENPSEDPDIRYSIKADEDRIFYTARGVEVVQNPTSEEYNQMREDILKEYPWLRGTGEPLFRHTYDEEGNEYYWEAGSGLHSQIEPEINEHYNTRTSQQYRWWEQPDKDDYPRMYSNKVDSEGNDLTEGQQTYFEKSQIRDDDGNLLVMYHGTDAYEDFTVFKPGKYGYLGKGMYFSASENYAKRYSEQNGYKGRIYKVYLNVTNPLVVTSDNPAAEILGEKVAAKRAAKNSYSTRWLTSADIKKLQDKGYDGIIWKYGKSPVEVSVWDPSQIKLTTNENPTNDPDIRFSDKVDDEYNELASRYYNIYEEEKKAFSGDVKRLTEAIVKRKVNLEDLNDRKLGLAADALLKEANSTYDRDELIGDLFDTYRYIVEGATYDGNVDWDAMMGRAYDTADKILSKAKAKTAKDGFYSEIIKSLKNTRVHLNDAQIAELKSQYDKDWNKVLFGKIRMVKDPAAISLDSLWHDLSHDYPDIFKQDVSDTDEPLMLIEAINDLNTLAEQNARAESQMDTVTLAESVYEKFWNIAILDTSIEKAMEARNRNALREQKIKAEHDLNAQKEFYEQKSRIEASKAQAEQYEAVKRAQDQGKQAVSDQKLADDIFFTAKERKAIRDRVEKDKQRVKELVAQHRQAMKDLTAAKNTERRTAVNQNRAEQKLADSIYYGKIFAKYKEKKAEDMRKYKEYVAKKAEERKEEAQRRAVISDITDMSKTLADWMRENGKKHRIPEPLKRPVGELLNAIDYSSKRLLGLTQGENAYMPTKKDISMGRALEQVRDIVARANKGQTSENIDDAFNGYIDFPPQYADDLTEISEKVNEIERKTKDGAYVLQMMSLDDLLELKEAVKIMKHTVSKMNSLISQTNAHSVDYYAQETINFANENAKELKDRNKAGQLAESAAKKAGGFINFTNGLPYYVFKHMGDGSKYMFSLLQNGWDKFAFNIKAISDFTEDLYTDKEVNEWTKEVHDVTVLEVATDEEKAEGKENTERDIKLTTAQIMSLYCLAKREQAKGHILGGGVRIADFKDEWRTISQSKAVTLTESELARITDMLTDRQKEVADELQKFMNTTCSEWGNEVTMKRFGIKAFTEENYFPIKSDSNVLRADVRDDVKSIYALLNMSFTKALVKNANNQIVVDDIFNVFTVHASDMAKYNSLALPVLDMIKWWNYSEKDERGGQSFTTRSVKIALENAYGKDANKYIRNLLSDINGAAESGRYDGLVNKMTKKYKIAAVGANLSVALLQPISYARAIYNIDKKYLVKGLAKKPSIEKCKQYVGIALWKSLGFYDTNINMGLDKIIKHADKTGDKLVDLSLKLAETGDSLTWGYLWNAVEAEISDTRNLAYGSEAFNEAVAERLREILYSTQVFDSTLSRSDIMRAKGMAQPVTAFMSEPTVTVNMMNDARIDFQREASKNGLNSAMRKHGKQVANACEAYILTATLEAVVRSVLDKLRDNDDDETFLETFLAELKDALNPLGKIPFLKDFVSIFQGYSPTRMDTSYAQSIYNAYKAITKVPENGWTYKTTYKLMQAIGQTTGLPLSNAMRELATLWNNTIGRMYPDLQLNK